MLFMNVTESIGVIMAAGAENLMGTMAAAMIFVLVFLVVIGIIFGIPFEFLGLLLLPFCLAVGAEHGEFMIPIVIIIIYISTIVAKNWLFR